MTDSEAKDLRDSLAGLEARGRLTPAKVVESARLKTSPLHDHFEWVDSVAAQHYRLEQARTLIRGIRVEIVNNKETISTVFYVRDPEKENDEQGYVSVDQLRNEPENVRAMLAAELTRVAAGLERAESLAKASGLEKQVKQTRKRVERLQASLEQHAGA